MQPLFLTDAEIHVMTGKKRYSAQIRWLRANGYQFMRRPDGAPLVSPLATRSDDGASENDVCESGLLEHHAIMMKALSARPVCGVYFLINGGRIMYVGKSINVMVRLQDHRRNKDKLFDAFTIVEASENDIGRIELEYIKKFMPPCNVQGRS